MTPATTESYPGEPGSVPDMITIVFGEQCGVWCAECGQIWSHSVLAQNEMPEAVEEHTNAHRKEAAV